VEVRPAARTGLPADAPASVTQTRGHVEEHCTRVEQADVVL